MLLEAVWWRCHRRIVADHLIAQGETVFHIMGEGRLEPARLTSGAYRRGRQPPSSTPPPQHRNEATAARPLALVALLSKGETMDVYSTAGARGPPHELLER